MRLPVKFSTSLIAISWAILSGPGVMAGSPAADRRSGSPAMGPPAATPDPAGKGSGRGPVAGGRRAIAPPAWSRGLYGPWIVLSNKDALGLRPEQVGALEKIMRETKSKREAADAKVAQASDALAKATAGATIDSTAALARLDEYSAAEQKARRVVFESMIEVRRVLDASQFETLRGLSRRGPGGGRGKTGAGSQAPAVAPPAAAAPSTH